VRRVDLRPTLDADLLQDRHQGLSEAAEGLLGLPYVDDAEAAPGLSGNVDEQALTGQSAGDSRRLRPPVSLRTDSSYRSCVRLGDWKTATTGIVTS
jgi:hypothetical protein